jgi:hypothetical protein
MNRSNYRINPITLAESTRSVTAEKHIVAEFDELPGQYGFRLRDVPSDNTVVIAGYTEILTGTPTGTEYRADYSTNSALVFFASGQAGQVVSVNYSGLGTVATYQEYENDYGGLKNYILNPRAEATYWPWVINESSGGTLTASRTSTAGELLEGLHSWALNFTDYEQGDSIAIPIDIEPGHLGEQFRFTCIFKGGAGFVQGDLKIDLYEAGVGTTAVIATGDIADGIITGTVTLDASDVDRELRFTTALAHVTGSDFEIFLDDLHFGPEQLSTAAVTQADLFSSKFTVDTTTGQIQNVFNSTVGTDYQSTLADGWLCRAWVNFNGTGTVAIRAAGNVSSITDNGTGDYTINFATAMPDSDFCYVFGSNGNSVDNPNAYIIKSYGTTGLSSSTLRIVCAIESGTQLDVTNINVAVFR